MDSGKPARHAAAAAAGQCAGAEGQHRLGDALGARATGRASRERRLRELPQIDGSGRFRAGEFRRGRPLARPEEGKPIDATGGLPDGSEFAGVAGLEQALLDRPELFVRTLTEKLLTFALGPGSRILRRAGRPQDCPRRAGDENYRFSSLIVGIVDQHAVSNEEVAMIITKKALPRRTFLRGVGAALALAAAGRHGSRR